MMSHYWNGWKCQIQWINNEPALKPMSVKWNGMNEMDEPVDKPMEVSNGMELRMKRMNR